MLNTSETVVLFPSLGMGHLIPMVELAKLFVDHNFPVIIIIANSPLIPSINSSFISHVSSTYPSISFHKLPEISPSSITTSNRMLANFQILHLSNAHLSEFLSQATQVRAIVLDMFCTYALQVAKELNIRAYFFFACCASCLVTFVLNPTIESQTTVSFKDLGETPLYFPGLPPIPASHMTIQLLEDRSSETYKGFSCHLRMLPKADGIIINTFELLERNAVEALVDGRCYPGQPMPPIYCIGPLISDGNGENEKHECITWLDAQPKGSVVFLCFGSMGAFTKEQVKEIAIGLERSKQRFLWVVRHPSIVDLSKRFDPRMDLVLDELLPEGFLERTKEMGMVVKSWAPQAKVLRHESVGGFVSHCGWNSILEAVSAGVPIIAWPLYAEQKMNKVFLTEVKLAVGMKGYDTGMVSMDEVEAKLRWLMESEGGSELKDQARAMKRNAEAARKDGGSSNADWMKLMTKLKKPSVS